jgi:hypothetical protein
MGSNWRKFGSQHSDQRNQRRHTTTFRNLNRISNPNRIFNRRQIGEEQAPSVVAWFYEELAHPEGASVCCILTISVSDVSSDSLREEVRTV